MAENLLGPIAAVLARLETVHTRRRAANGEMRPVENEDSARALVRFAGGAGGSFEISRVAMGFKCGLTFTVFGTAGSISFDQERMNELRFYSAADAAGRRGFRTILAGPEHPDYAFFCPAPGHGLGINDLKVIEARNLLFLGAALPREAAGVASNLAVGEDAFENAAGNDYRLVSSSPAIDRGEPGVGFATDRFGTQRPQGSAWDVGAIERCTRPSR